MGPVRQNPIQRPVSLFICVCIALCTTVAHNIAQNRPDNFPSCPPSERDDVYVQLGDDDEVVPRLKHFDEVDDARMRLGQQQHVNLVQSLVSTVATSTTLMQELGRVVDTGRPFHASLHHGVLASVDQTTSYVQPVFTEVPSKLCGRAAVVNHRWKNVPQK